MRYPDRDWPADICAFAVVAVPVYLVAAAISWDFNPAHSHFVVDGLAGLLIGAWAGFLALLEK